MYYNLISSMSSGIIAPSYTARTTAFASATAITDTTILNALNTFDLGLISNGLDTKMKAIYPFVGGTSTTHKYNFMNSVDSNEAFRLQFNGGWTHSSTGAAPNGTNAYADTKLQGTILTQDSTHISSYSRTNNNMPTPLISGTNAILNLINIWPRYSSSNDVYFRINSNPTSPATTSLTSFGLYIANRITSIETRNFIRNQLFIQSSGSSGVNDGFIYLSKQDSAYDSREQAFSSIGDGLTDTDASNLYTLVQAFQTSLSRQV